ncbi:NEL-type E3 ubiquitin ligase domain-containing protein [Pseudomonas sp.]|uniref:NEL-type E3 ubiquitin ligase domain-containing protein n=1 Tax=Pseudomonas sp. TaxID=306 RepID=UPI003FD8DEC4
MTVSPRSNAKNPVQPNLHFIKSNTPAWLKEADPTLRETLRVQMAVSSFSRTRVAEVLEELQSIDTFAEPLLTKALQDWFNVKVDVRTAIFFNLNVDYRTSSSSLLEAALQNFEAHEGKDGAFKTGSGVFLNEHSGERLPITPEQFARACRNLNLGQLYQDHLDSVFQPYTGLDENPVAVRANRRALFLVSERDALSVEITVARIKGDISESAHQMMLQVAAQRSEASLPSVVRLTLFETPIHKIVVISADRSHEDGKALPCVAYIPGDPLHPLKEYASTADFAKALTERLGSADYQQFFSRFITQRQRPAFFKALNTRLFPSLPYRVFTPDPVLQKGAVGTSLIKRMFPSPSAIWTQTLDKNATLSFGETPLVGNLFLTLYRQQLQQVLDDARYLVVRTDDEDFKSSLAFYDEFLSIGLSVLNLAAFFVPGVGEIMMVVAGAQLFNELFEGVEAWNHAEVEEALAHLFGVASNAALIVALGASGASHVPAVEGSAFIDTLIEVKLANGQSRLWKVDLKPFESDVLLPDWVAADAEGRITLEGKDYLPLNDKLYRIALDPAINTWRLKPPVYVETYSPLLEHNGAGAWRVEGESPHSWQINTLFKRLGYSVDSFSEKTAEHILALTGTDETLLRRIHLGNQAPTPQLADTIKRFRLDQELVQSGAHEDLPAIFNAQYQASEASADPLINVIKRDFPSITTAAAKEIIVEANATEIAQMTGQQRIPSRLAGQARVYVRETQLNRAYEGFFLASGSAHPDTLKLALVSLEKLPGWPTDLMIEVRHGSTGGELLNRVGSPTASQVKTLVKRGKTYQAHDSEGNELHAPADFFTAVMQALPDSARESIGVSGVWNVSQFRERLAAVAMGQRDHAARVLGQSRAKQSFTVPSRLSNSRIGYLLSGRGAMAAAVVYQQESAEALSERLRTFYPESADAGHVDRLAGRDVARVSARLNEQIQAFGTLRNALDGWVDISESNPLLTALERQTRGRIADELSRAWRYSEHVIAVMPEPRTTFSLDSVTLPDLSDLPDLPDYYSKIEEIILSNVTADAEQFDVFLSKFTGLKELSITNGGLSRVPAGLTGFAQLNYVSIACQDMVINQQAMDIFVAMPRLLTLDLSGNTLGSFAGSSGLRLDVLALESMGLTEWPQWVEDIPLQELDISDNQIVHLPDHILQNQRHSNQHLTVRAYGNPISHDDLQTAWVNDSGWNQRYSLLADYPDDIRALHSRRSSPSESEASDDLFSAPESSDSEPPTPDPQAAEGVHLWQVPGSDSLNSRIELAWQRVEETNDAPDLLSLIQQLRGSEDFNRVREELTIEVLGVLEAAAEDAELRGILNARAAQGCETCTDGARLLFSDVQVEVYSRNALLNVPEEGKGGVLFKLGKSLFRLEAVEAIAEKDIATRKSMRLLVDEAEVRLAYRTDLADRLGLPAQPHGMNYRRIAGVSEDAIISAEGTVLQREQALEYVDSMIQKRFWSDYLHQHYVARFEERLAAFDLRLEDLTAAPPAMEGEYLNQVNALRQEREEEELRVLSELTLLERWTLEGI